MPRQAARFITGNVRAQVGSLDIEFEVIDQVILDDGKTRQKVGDAYWAPLSIMTISDYYKIIAGFGGQAQATWKRGKAYANDFIVSRYRSGATFSPNNGRTDTGYDYSNRPEPTGTVTPKPEPVTAKPDFDLSELVAIIRSAVDAKTEGMAEAITTTLSATVETMVREAVSNVAPVTYVVGGKPTVTFAPGTVHEVFPELLDLIAMGIHPFLVGPAGSGKTTVASQVAEALALPFYPIQCGPEMSIYDLTGFTNAAGQATVTAFTNWCKNGGVVVFDEGDAMGGEVAIGLNSALSNGWINLPEGKVILHESCVAILCGNTYGTGATSQYIGRGAGLDLATLDRFEYVEMGYDPALEEAMVMSICPEQGMEWLKRVRVMRENAANANLQVIVSPRRSINGAKMLAYGWPMDRVMATIMRRFQGDAKRKVGMGVS